MGSAWYLGVPGASECLVPWSTWYLGVPGTSECLVPRSTWYLGVPGTSEYLVPRSAWCLGVPGTLEYLVPRSTWYLGVPGTSECLQCLVTVIPGSSVVPLIPGTRYQVTRYLVPGTCSSKLPQHPGFLIPLYIWYFVVLIHGY